MRIVSQPIERGKQKGEYITVWIRRRKSHGRFMQFHPLHLVFVSELSHKSWNAHIKLRVYEFVDCIQPSYVRVM